MKPSEVYCKVFPCAVALGVLSYSFIDIGRYTNDKKPSQRQETIQPLEEITDSSQIRFKMPNKDQHVDCFSYDTSAPFTVFWKPKVDEPMTSLTLKTTDKESGKTEEFQIPSVKMLVFRNKEMTLIELVGQHVGQQTRYETSWHMEEDVTFLAGEYKTEVELKTKNRVYKAEVDYVISR